VEAPILACQKVQNAAHRNRFEEQFPRPLLARMLEGANRPGVLYISGNSQYSVYVGVALTKVTHFE
jgi:hypothetical protein